MWSKEKAWKWYNSKPWLRGCNFMSSDCANRIDQWQEYGFEERLATADKELALAAETGFNTVRLIPEFFVWQQEHDGFMERFERYISTCDKHGISCMIVFGNDCMPPKKEDWRPFELGEQKYDWGYHGGRKNSQHGTFTEVGYHIIDDAEIALQHYEWVREIVEKYKNDERIIMWDVWNEPGNSNRKALSLPHIKKFFEIIREIDPIQPLTSAVWKGLYNLDTLPEESRYILENSDIVSYHCYLDYEYNIIAIKNLKRLGRPIINTEWLGRCRHNNVQEMFPLFYLEKIGCYNWGFVAGKYQTYEPYNSAWDQLEENPDMDFDFTKWYHDLYRPNLHPYDPQEIKIIKKFCSLSDKDFAKNR